MKRFRCRCGERVFFENTRCIACETVLGFDPITLEVLSLDWNGVAYEDDRGRSYKPCKNHADFNNCNWLIKKTAAEQYCKSCQLNRTIPNLKLAGNWERWSALEKAKRRLIYSLLTHRLPVLSQAHGWPNGLAFDFIEDKRSNPSVKEEFVGIGHLNGVITINVAEADDIYRLKMRTTMEELYRTVLGHFRHESGHYYFNLLVENDCIDSFRLQFGDETIDYTSALEDYYNNGPSADWSKQHISAYASAHPLEDWAETWGHYLLIKDGLETAQAEGLLGSVQSLSLDSGLQLWIDTTIKLNQLSRDLGLEDPYPFILNDKVREKLGFVHELLHK